MAKDKSMSGALGGWAFLIGVVLAVLLGAFASELTPVWIMILALIGLVIGLLNVADHEVTPFLMSGAILIIASSFGQEVMGTVPAASGILSALLAIFVPATIIVAIKHVFSLARN